MKKTYITRTPIALVATMMMSQAYADHTVLHDVVVTATPMTSPFLIETDPKQPRQPLPAHDGADYLKTIPGFTVMRKGGTDGEAIFRGMAGSRLNILVDDQNIVGGCNMRMDAPTAYIFPEAYDKLTVIKGPQTVQYANMGTAATIKFDKEVKVYEKPSAFGYLSGLVGSFGRHDEIIQADAGSQNMYANITATNSQSGNYKDGSGNEYHSGYHRWSNNAAVGLTPDANTRIELNGARSDGWAKYADRGMDGTKFLRENIALKFEKKNISGVLNGISAQVSQNKVDHIMDNIRFNSGSASARVGHYSDQAKLGGNFSLTDKTKLLAGVDFSETSHRSGNSLAENALFSSYGFYGELTQNLSLGKDAIFGFRVDRASADYIATSLSRNENLYSGFARFESVINDSTKSFVGFGHAERFPDYWELVAPAGTVDAGQFSTLKVEKTNQIDLGVIRKTAQSNLSGSVFYNKINDFILINHATANALNVDAYTYGVELDGSYKVNDQLKLISSLTYVKGVDQTNNAPLAQLPPLELRAGVNYAENNWFIGGLMRYVAAKNDFNLNYGNIAGKDLGATPSFAIFSINGGYSPAKKVKLYAGVDNIFDKTYAEFVSRTGSPTGMMVPPISPQTTRVNEPGRTAWLKATIALD